MYNSHVTRSKELKKPIIAKNRVLANTYFLLGLSLLCSAITAITSMYIMAPHTNILLHIVILYGLLFFVQRNAHSAWGIGATFLFTGYMGYSLGPILNMVLYSYGNGAEILALTTGSTGLIFIGLSAYAILSGKSFSYLGGTLFMLLFTGIILSISAMLFNFPLLGLFVNALFIMVFSGLILYHTSEIIEGGETNYILATISLYLAIYNLFLHILHLMMMLNSSSRD